MPEFTLTGLLVICWRRHGRSISIRYGKLPLYLRALTKISLPSEERLISWFGKISRSAIEKIGHEERLSNYPAINLRAMEEVVPATLALRSELRKSGRMRLAARLIGEEEALALGLQIIAHRWVWPQLLQIMAMAAALPPGQQIQIVLRPGWPSGWNHVWKPATLETTASYFAWPNWYVRAVDVLRGLLATATGMAATLLAGLKSAGIKHRAPVNARLISEFIDPTHLNGTPHDVDYWVDGQRIRPADLLLFATHEQTKRLRKRGWTVKDLTKQIELKGYQIAWIERMPIRLRDFRALMLAWMHSLSSFTEPALTADILMAAGEGVLRFAPLLSRARANACLYIKIPNGFADWRQDTAVLTGLCRRAGIVAAGCQTRVVYGSLYEFAFDCYDIHVCWGSGWYRSLQSSLYIIKMVNVGCPVLDLLMPLVAKVPKHGFRRERQVLIFTGDVGGGHCTFDYNISLLEACLDLASAHESDRFIVKAKDPQHVDRFTSDSRIKGRLSKCANLEFLRRSRHDYAENMANADFVIAFGFTTPGTEALLLGKPAVYYSKLETGGEVFEANPSWVVRDAEELSARYQAWIDSGCTTSIDGLDALDPYRDGQARERVLNALMNE